MSKAVTKTPDHRGVFQGAPRDVDLNAGSQHQAPEMNRDAKGAPGLLITAKSAIASNGVLPSRSSRRGEDRFSETNIALVRPIQAGGHRSGQELAIRVPCTLILKPAPAVVLLEGNRLPVQGSLLDLGQSCGFDTAGK